MHVEDPVVDATGAAGVDDRALRALAHDEERVGHVEVAGLAQVFVRAGDGQGVGPGLEPDDVVAGVSVGADDGAAQAAVVEVHGRAEAGGRVVEAVDVVRVGAGRSGEEQRQRQDEPAADRGCHGDLRLSKVK